MRIRFFVLALVVMAAIAGYGLTAARPQAQSGQQWEYTTLDFHGGMMGVQYEDIGLSQINGLPVDPPTEQTAAEILNAYGLDGWELVTVEQRETPTGGGGRLQLSRYILKRPI